MKKKRNRNPIGKIMKCLFAYLMIISLLLPMLPVNTSAAGKLAISSKKITIDAGKSKTLKIKNAKKKVTWSSKNKKIATVSKKGKVTGKKEGTTKITAKTAGKKFTCTVKVKAALNASTVTLQPGQTKTLKVLGTSKKFTWSSDKNSVATVSNKGVVTAKAVGTATITAKYKTQKLKAKITVETKEEENKDSVTISFTNGDIEKKAAVENIPAGDWITSKAKTVTITGKLSSIKNVDNINYSLKNQAGTVVSSGAVTIADTFSITVSPAVGFNTFTVEVTKKSGKYTGVLYIHQFSTEIVQESKTGKVIVANDKEITEINDKIVGYYADEENGTIHLIVSKDSELYNRIENDDIKKGDTYYVPPCEDLPSGSSMVYEKTTAPSNEDYDSTEYAEVEMRQPTQEEALGKDGNITIDSIDETNPVSFIMMPDGTNVYGSSMSQKLVVTPIGKDVENKDYPSKFFPKKFQALSPSVSYNGAKKTADVKISLSDFVIFDGDQMEKTEGDRIVLDGSLEIADIQNEMNIDWSNWKVNQIIQDTSYTETAKLSVKTGISMDMSDFVKTYNNNFKNSMSIGGFEIANMKTPETTISGIGMGNRMLLCVVGLNAKGVPKVTSGSGSIKELSDKNKDAIVFVALYIDLKGEISATVTSEVNYSDYHAEGFNLVRKNAVPIYGLNKNKYDENKEYGNFTLYKYSKTQASKSNATKPELKWTTQGEIEGSVTAGMGIMAGVMVAGIIPADLYGCVSASAKGTLTGGPITITPKTTLEDLAKIPNITAKMTMEAKAEAGIEVKLKVSNDEWKIFNDLGVEGSFKATKEIFKKEFELPLANMTGTVKGKVQLTDPDDQLVNLDGVAVRVYDKEDLEIDKDGNPTVASIRSAKEVDKTTTDKDGYYFFEKLPVKEYLVLLEKSGYESYHEFYKLEQFPKRENTVEIEDKKYSKKDFIMKPGRDENWLDVLQPYDYIDLDSAGHDLLMGDSPKYVMVSGVKYHVGFMLNPGNQGASGEEKALLNLGGKFDSLDVRVGRSDDSFPLDADLKVYLDGAKEPSQTIALSARDTSTMVNLNFHGAQSAIIAVEKKQVRNWSTAHYWFVDGVWNTIDGPKGTLTPTDPFAGVDMTDSNFMNVLSPCYSKSATLCNPGKDNASFKMSGATYDTGFMMKGDPTATEVELPYVTLNPAKRMSSLQITIGHVDGTLGWDVKVYVYKNGVKAQEIPVKASDPAKTYTIDLSGVESLRFGMDNVKDNWNTVGIGFADGKWIPAK